MATNLGVQLSNNGERVEVVAAIVVDPKTGLPVLPGGVTVADGANVVLGATTDVAGASTIMGQIKSAAASLVTLLTTLAGRLNILRPPLTYTEVAGSPFTLTATWQKVATATTATAGLRLAPVAPATAYDIQWCAVPANAAAPSLIYGEPIQGGEDFAAGLPVGDIYLKSTSGQIATVKTGA